MNYYATPKRRHSSLFQRMENEIKKISKKLSAAKQSYKGANLKPPVNHFTSYNSLEERNNATPTARKYQQPTQATKTLKYNTLNLRRKPNQGFGSKIQTINLDDQLFQHSYTSNANKIILKLQDENSKLSHRLGKVQQICEDQSYKLGYVKAELKQANRQIEIQKQKQFKQSCYLTTLLQYYKNKVHKYKEISKQNKKSAVSIDIESDKA